MAELEYPWLSAVFLVGGAALASSMHPLAKRQPRHFAVLVWGVVLLLTLGPLFEFAARGSGWLTDPWLTAMSSLGIDRLSALLLPFAALLSLVLAAVAPGATLTIVELRSSLITGLLVLAMFSCRNAIALAILWTASIVVALAAIRGPAHRRAFAVASPYLGLSVVLFWAGVLAPKVGQAGSTIGAVLLLAAVMIRKGIVPLHGWMPEMFEGGSIGQALSFSAPQVGAYVAVVLILPDAATGISTSIGMLSLATAVYAAAISIVQSSPRRAFGWLFMSQSALVMAGLDSSSLAGLAGALCLWISSGLALVGFGTTIWVLEARRGPLRLDELHGGHEGMPLLASSFLIFGLASIGFPGTLGFIATELLIDGAVEHFPRFGFAVAVAGALNGVCVLRMYFSLFCGGRGHRGHAPLLPRERIAFAGLVALLLAAGLFPRPIVESRSAAARDCSCTRTTRS